MAGTCIANHMRTGEIIDLAQERRLSAVLEFTSAGAELLILNGGSRAEEFNVVIVARGRVRKERRSAYCIDSGTSMNLSLPLLPGESAADISLRIVGGHGEMVLAEPAAPSSRRLLYARGISTLAAAVVLALLAGGRLSSPTLMASADPEPAPPEPPLVRPSVSLQVPTRLPNVVSRALVARRPLLVSRRLKPVEHHVVVAAVPLVKRAEPEQTPAPRMTDLQVPNTAKSGDYIPVRFGAVGRQVKIVASIGPTIVSKTIVAAQNGVISIRSPKSDRDSRIMTVRAYAEDGNRVSSLQAMVVLVHP